MSDIQIHEGDSYIAIYHDGPFDGQTAELTATTDAWDEEVTAYALVENLETAFTYKAEHAGQAGDQIHVNYRFVPDESDPVLDPEDRRDATGEFDRS